MSENPVSQRSFSVEEFDDTFLKVYSKDSWVYIDNIQMPELLLSDEIDLSFRVRKIMLSDLYNIKKGHAGYLFPFIFKSVYIRIAKLEERIDRSYSISEQVLFWLIESGAEIRLPYSQKKETSRSALLPEFINSHYDLASYFFFKFSSSLPGISINKFPDRFSYKSVFWNSDCGKYLYKVYRYPKISPSLNRNNPVFIEKISNIATYYDTFEIETPFCTNHLVIKMENITGFENSSDYFQNNKPSLRERGVFARKYTHIWMKFLKYGQIPLDLSLSNTLIDRNFKLVLIDMEESLTIGIIDSDRGRWAVFCYLSLLFYLLTDYDFGGGKEKYRYDIFRNKCFIPMWNNNNDKWECSNREINRTYPEMIELFGKLLNGKSITLFNDLCMEIHNYVEKTVKTT